MTKVKLYDLNMVEIILRGVKWLEFTPDPPSSDRITDNVWNGDIVLGHKRNSRMIRARFMYQSYDFLDYKLSRDEKFEAFDPTKKMYAIDQAVPGKRWKVGTESYSPDRINGTTAEVAVVFYCAEPYAKSRGTTLDPFTFDSELWGYGMGLQADAGTQDYIHTTTSFSIHNAGNVEVDPCESELLITLTSSTATSTDLFIKNLTNLTEWQYTGAFNTGQVITIDRTISELNSAGIVHLTNLDLISLVPGTNNFVIEGLTGSFEITFEFRYLYL